MVSMSETSPTRKALTMTTLPYTPIFVKTMFFVADDDITANELAARLRSSLDLCIPAGVSVTTTGRVRVAARQLARPFSDVQVARITGIAGRNGGTLTGMVGA